MYGDTQVVRRRAQSLRDQGQDLRQVAERLVAEVDQIDWQGRAADSMRERIRERAAHLREAAGRHDTAADSLDRHAGETDRLKDTIAETERTASSLIADARARSERAAAQSSDGVRVEADPQDRALLDFTPPAAGHKDWLDAELPGLS